MGKRRNYLLLVIKGCCMGAKHCVFIINGTCKFAVDTYFFIRHSFIPQGIIIFIIWENAK